MAVVQYANNLYDSATGQVIDPASAGYFSSEGRWYSPSNEVVETVYTPPATTLALSKFDPASASAYGLPAGYTRDLYGNTVLISSLPGEEQGYVANAIVSDKYKDLLATPDDQQSAAWTWLEQNPGALGQYLSRWQPTGTGLFGQTTGWNYSPEEYVAATLSGAKLPPLASIDPSLGARFLSEQSPEAQAARDAASEAKDLRAYLTMAAIVGGGVYGGLSGIGTEAAATGATASDLAAAASAGAPLGTAGEAAVFGTPAYAAAPAAAEWGGMTGADYPGTPTITPDVAPGSSFVGPATGAVAPGIPGVSSISAVSPSTLPTTTGWLDPVSGRYVDNMGNFLPNAATSAGLTLGDILGGVKSALNTATGIANLSRILNPQTGTGMQVNLGGGLSSLSPQYEWASVPDITRRALGYANTPSVIRREVPV